MPTGPLKDADENEIAAQIRKALGIGPDEYAEVTTPQHERRDGVEPAEPPLVPAEFDQLKMLSEAELTDLGLRPWDKEEGIWLFPGEWYAHIPEGYEVTNIAGMTSEFEPGVSDDDIRFGCLPYGIRVDDPPLSDE